MAGRTGVAEPHRQLLQQYGAMVKSFDTTTDFEEIKVKATYRHPHYGHLSKRKIKD